MISQPSPTGESTTSANALRVLELFASAAGVSFDRILSRRILSESERAVCGSDAQTWSRRLVDAGESVNLRVRSLECSLAEALMFVRQGTPIAYCSDTADGNIRWLVLTGTKGRKIRVVDLRLPGQELIVSARRISRELSLASRSERSRWVLGQPALSCQPGDRASGHPSPGKPVRPLARLIGLIRPEKSDLWVVLVFSLVVGLLALATPVAVEALVNTVAFGRYLQPVLILALLLFTFLSFAAAMRGLITYIVEIFQRRLFIRVVEDLAYRLPRVKQEEFDSKNGPELVNRFFDIVTVQKTSATMLLDGIAIVLQTVIGMAVLAFYHPFLLGFDIVLLMLISFTVIVLGRGAVKTAIVESKAKFAVAAWLEELAQHPSAFKMHSGNHFALERADQLAVKWLDARRGHFRVVMRQILFALGLQAFAATALLGLGGWLVIVGELTLGQLVAAELIVMMIVSSFAKLGKHMESFYDLLAGVDKLGQLFDLQTEPHDKLYHLQDGQPASMKVHGVGYKYPSGAVGLQEIGFEMVPSESLALVGPSGSGKSTLVDLICGTRIPTSGHIEIDGIDLREVRPDSLREHLALARRVEIFHGTIAENVHLNRTNVKASDVRDALSAVGLVDELMNLPDGLSTVLQINGAPLSSTQAVRLMIARAIVGRPRLLLIDEILDGLPDEMLTGLLANLAGKDVPWTLLVSTGKQVVTKVCDRTVSLAESGTSPTKLESGVST